MTIPAASPPGAGPARAAAPPARDVDPPVRGDLGQGAAAVAAQALLGALLWDSRRLDDISGWLQVEDFGGWEHRAVYRTLLALHRDEPLDPAAVLAALDAGTHHDSHIDRRRPVAAMLVHTLLTFTPATPAAEVMTERGTVASSEHIRYGQLVLADSVRRQVDAAGTCLAQHISEAFDQDRLASLDERIDRLEHGLSIVVERLHALAARLPTDRSSAPVRPGPRPAPGRAAAAAAVGAGYTPPAAAHAAERHLLGACLQTPSVRTLAAATLRPHDFTDPHVAATWQAMLALQDRGDPVDFVLVAAEVERRGGGLAGSRPGLAAMDLADLAHRRDLALGQQHLLEVLTAALHRVAQQTTRHLRDAVSNPVLTPHQVVRRAHAALVCGRDDVRRLAGERDTPGAASSRIPPPRRTATPDTAAPGTASPESGRPAGPAAATSRPPGRTSTPPAPRR